jgi:hypothetical protein
MTEIFPCWRYSKEFPEGQIFQSAADLKAASGEWFDSPAKLVEKPAETYREHMEKWPAKDEAKALPVSDEYVPGVDEPTLEQLAAECKARGIHHKKYMGKSREVMLSLLAEAK